MFGEIGLMTSIRRTCSVITTDNCLMVKLCEDGLSKIKDKFPSIFENIQDSISNYFDRDTCQRVRFIQNIPMFRFLDQKSLYRISYLLVEDWDL